MKILFVAHTYPRWAGDRAGAQVYRFAEAALERGHQVLVVAPHAAGAIEGREVLGGIEVHRFRYASDAGERIGYQGAVAKSLGSPAALLILPHYLKRFRAAVREAVLGYAPDVISVHWWAPGALATDGVAVPVAVTCHGSDVRLLGSPLVRIIGRPVLGRVAGLSAVSQLMADDLARWVGRTDVAVTRMPVDDARFVPTSTCPEPPGVLCAGNLIRAKGVDLILRAAAAVHRTGLAFRLRLVGDGPDRRSFEALTGELGIGSIVDWAGPVGHEQMPREFAGASVLVLASRGKRGEGLPLTVVEALLSGCVVVATPAGGVPELVVDGETGLIARDEDADHLAEQLGRVLRDAPLRSRLGAAGRTRALAQHGRGAAMDHFFEFLARAAGQGTA